MSFAGAPAFLLPPRPALIDWPLAGACAGSLLALAELGLCAGEPPPPRVALLSATTLALGLALAALLLGLALRTFGARPSYSTLVAWVAGLIALAAVAPAVLELRGAQPGAAYAALAFAVLAALAVAFAAARVADRSERAGLPASARLWWGATALLVAAGERAAQGALPLRISPALLLAGLVLGAGAVATALFAFARRRGVSRPRASFAYLVVLLVPAAVAAAYTPAALPWLLADRERADLSDAPASILILAFGRAGDAPAQRDADRSEVLSGWRGLRYEAQVSEPARALEALLTLPDGEPLLPSLAGAGYQTAAILRDAALAGDVGVLDLDARAGGRARLHGDLRWLAAAPWLAGPGSELLGRLGFTGATRSPDQLAGDARDWLLRRGGTRIPFFLLVDFRSGEPAADETVREQEAAADLIDSLEAFALADRTVVLLARTGGAGEPPLRVVVQPPLAWPGIAEDGAGPRSIAAGELGSTLQRIGRGNAATPVAFPGFVDLGRR
jgi:hypothetical protein